MLRGNREGSKWLEFPEWVRKRQETAYSFIQYADINNFHADPNAPAEDQPEAEYEAEGEDDGEADDEGDEEAEDEEVDEEIEAEVDTRIVPASDAPSSSGAAGP